MANNPRSHVPRYVPDEPALNRPLELLLRADLETWEAFSTELEDATNSYKAAQANYKVEQDKMLGSFAKEPSGISEEDSKKAETASKKFKEKEEDMNSKLDGFKMASRRLAQRVKLLLDVERHREERRQW